MKKFIALSLFLMCLPYDISVFIALFLGAFIVYHARFTWNRSQQNTT